VDGRRSDPQGIDNLRNVAGCGIIGHGFASDHNLYG
jgi:hypothetical protein